MHPGFLSLSNVDMLRLLFSGISSSIFHSRFGAHKLLKANKAQRFWLPELVHISIYCAPVPQDFHRKYMELLQDVNTWTL